MADREWNPRIRAVRVVLDDEQMPVLGESGAAVAKKRRLIPHVVKQVREQQAVNWAEGPGQLGYVPVPPTNRNTVLFRRQRAQRVAVEVHRMDSAARREHRRQRACEDAITAAKVRPDLRQGRGEL